jgi:hypothetical protein
VAPVTLATEKVSGPVPQAKPACDIVPGVAGVDEIVTASVCAELFPQVPLAVTEILPPVDPAVADILLVVELPDHELGKVQVYEPASATGETEYVFVEVLQTLFSPVMADGIAGTAITCTANVCAAVLPQPLLAVTNTFPPVVPRVA